MAVALYLLFFVSALVGGTTLAIVGVLGCLTLLLRAVLHERQEHGSRGLL